MDMVPEKCQRRLRVVGGRHEGHTGIDVHACIVMCTIRVIDDNDVCGVMGNGMPREILLFVFFSPWS